MATLVSRFKGVTLSVDQEYYLETLARAAALAPQTSPWDGAALAITRVLVDEAARYGVELGAILARVKDVKAVEA